MKTLKRYLFIIVIFLLSFESFGNEDLENSNSQDIEDDIWDTNFKPRLSQDEEQENCNKIFETVKTNSLWEDEEVIIYFILKYVSISNSSFSHC